MSPNFLLRALEATLVLFVTVNPFQWLPLFLRRTGTLSDREQNHLSLILALVVTTLVGFSFAFGRLGLHLLGLRPTWLETTLETGWLEASLGLLLIIFGLKSLLFAVKSETGSKPMTARFALFPLAFPLLVSPSTMTAAIYYSTRLRDPEDGLIMGVGIALVGVSTGYVFYRAQAIGRRLGERGLVIYRRLNDLAICFAGTVLAIQGLRQLL